MDRGVGIATGYPWPVQTRPAAGPHAWVGHAQAGPPPVAPDCVACWLPPLTAAHADVARMRSWLEAVAGTGCRAVYRPEAVPSEPQRHRLALSFAHVCRVLCVAAAVEVGPAGVPEPLAAVLERWPELAVAVQVQDAPALVQAAAVWGGRLALALVPPVEAVAAARTWRGPGWVVAQAPVP